MMTKDEALKILKEDTNSFENLPKKFRDNEEIVTFVMSQQFDNKYNKYFKFVSPRLKKDRDFILRLLSEKENDEDFISSLFIEFIHKDLKNDIEIATKALTKNGYALKYISKRLKYNEDLCIIALKSNPYCHNDIPKKLLDNNDEILKLAVEGDGLVLHRVPEQLRTNKELLKIGLRTAMFDSGSLLVYTSEEYIKDKEVLLIALKKDKCNLKFLDKELIKEIGENDPVAYLESLINYEKIVQNVVRKNTNNKKIKI